jgi:hypothetical protein
MDWKILAAVLVGVLFSGPGRAIRLRLPGVWLSLIVAIAIDIHIACMSILYIVYQLCFGQQLMEF